MARVSLLLVVAATAAAAFAAKVVISYATRKRWPQVAAAVERWWVWTPLVVICLYAIWVVPPIGIAATILALIVLTRTDAIGSPFRPRR